MNDCELTAELFWPLVEALEQEAREVEAQIVELGGDMEEGARIDYFRSEIKGEMAKLEKQLADHRTQTAAALRGIDERLEKMVRELKHLEMSAR